MRRFPLLVVLGVLLSAGNVFAQSQTNPNNPLNVGRNWGSEWPGGLTETRTNPDIRWLVANNWSMRVATLLTDFNVPGYFESDQQLANTTQNKFTNDRTDDLGDFTRTFFVPVGQPGPKTFRTAPPALTQDGTRLLTEEWRLFPERNDRVVSSLGSDIMFESQTTGNAGLKEVYKRFMWSNENAQDIIFEITTYTYPTTPLVPDLRVGERGAAPSPETVAANPALKELYLGQHWFQQAAQRGPSGGAHITVVPGTRSRPFAVGISHGIFDEVNYWDDVNKLMYSHDGDATDVAGYRSDGDDRGEPGPPTGNPKLDEIREAQVGPGEFLESEYKGRVFLHVDKTPVSDPNTLSENWLDDLNEPDPEARQPRLARWVLGQNWTSTANAKMERVHDFYVQPNSTREDRIGPVGPPTSDPETAGWVGPQENFWEWQMTFGPWPELKAGESIHIVSAWIIAGPSIEMNKRVGKQWSDGSISKEDRDIFLNSGLDSMMARIAVAREAWAAREVNSSVGLQPKLPSSPAWPSSVDLVSGPDQNELSWGASPDASTYRVYRTSGFETKQPALIGNNISGTSFIDDNVIRGTRYYYAVTAVNSSGLESSRFATRTLGDGVSPFRAPGRDITSVRIVPNPFQIQGGPLDQGGFNFPGQAHKLLFVNLPAQAVIRIFSISGDLIQEIKHTAGSGDLSWDLMINDNNQFLTSGIYFAHIESLDPQVPGSHVEKFIVVR